MKNFVIGSAFNPQNDRWIRFDNDDDDQESDDGNWTDDDDVQYDGDGATCLLYTSPSPRDRQKSRMPSSA